MMTEAQSPKVFISYSHDSQEHFDCVLRLSDTLREWGIDCHIDQYELAPADWVRWMESRIRKADFVLIVCTATYCRRFNGEEEPGKGLGVRHEGGVISAELYNRQTETAKFIPVVFSVADSEHIPTPLQNTHRHQLEVEKLEKDRGFENLYRHLTGQPRVVAKPLGMRRSLPPINRSEDFDDKEIEDISNEVISRLIAESPKPKAIQLTGKSFIEDLGNGVKLEMIAIPGGSFQMGSEDFENTKPIHQVTLSPFHIGKFQVTQQQWQALMGSAPTHYKGDNLPVENVSWHRAFEFCVKLSERTGRTYRLPTEAEWEYSCRAGSTGRYCLGDNNALLDKYAWHLKNAGDKTHPVGEKLANDWGLHDMHGNVWEWCQDWYDEDYYWESPEVNPHGPQSGIHRVLRGSAFCHPKNQCHSASRGRFTPDTIYRYVGFRVVCVAKTS